MSSTMMVQIINTVVEYDVEIKYAFIELFRHINVDIDFNSKIDYSSNKPLIIYGPMKINAGLTDRPIIHIKSHSLFFQNALYSRKSIPNIKSIYKDTPVFFKDNNEPYYSLLKNNYLVTNIDLPATVFFFLTLYDEYLNVSNRDDHGRYTYKSSFINRMGLIETPIVDMSIDIFIQEVKKVGINFSNKKYWRNSDFAFCITQDIDNLLKYGPFHVELYRHFKLINKPNKFKKSVKQYIKSKINVKNDPYWSFDETIKLQVPITYFFLIGGSSSHDNKYLNKRMMKNMLSTIPREYSEVGLHTSYSSFGDLESIAIEKALIEKHWGSSISGNRNHWLRFDVTKSWDIYHELGFEYDTTVGFAEHEGFRAGTCRPYKTYSHRKRIGLGLWEVPLLIMDGTLVQKKYRGLDQDEGILKIKSLIDTVRRHNGVVNMLWHNSSFVEEFENWKFVLPKSVVLCRSKNGTGFTISDVIKRLEE